MARDKQIADLMSAVERSLFVSDEPVSAARLADILEVGPVQVDEALVALAAEYRDENSRYPAARGGGRMALLHASRPQRRHRALRHLMGHASHVAGRSRALAVIAYHQPVTRARWSMPYVA